LHQSDLSKLLVAQLGSRETVKRFFWYMPHRETINYKEMSHNKMTGTSLGKSYLHPYKVGIFYQNSMV